MMLRAQTCAVGALLLAAGLGLLAWSAQHRAARLAEEARAAEQRALRAEGLRAAEAASAARLRREVADLRDQLAKVGRAMPGARVREVVRWKTNEVRIPCPPVVESGSRGRSPGGRAGRPPAAGPRDTAAQQVVGTSPHEPARPWLSLRFEIEEARVESRAGTRVAVGLLDVYRTDPPPEALVARLPLEATLHLENEPMLPRHRWGVGPAVGLVNGSLAWGAIAEGPPARLWGFDVRPAAFALASRDDWVVAGALVVHW